MNSGKKFFFSLLAASIMGGFMALGAFQLLQKEQPEETITEKQNVLLSRFSSQSESSKAAYKVPEGLNFVEAANLVTPAVVHIKTRYGSEYGGQEGNSLEDMFNDLFPRDGDGYHGGNGPRMSSGSGVIISADGYIATNNHVIEGAKNIEVVLNDKRSYRATLVGVDPTTDLALLKIAEQNLDFVPYGNSDNVQIGQWVLAVGNPFDLTSTVTAGIVSAKARNINILHSKVPNYSIEAFIQTDAAVNPGNSGGALVDLNGRLVGLNTAIATNTGSYAGYSFAVPVTLVKKVMDDLLNFGEVQRALMGVSIQDIDADFADREGLEKVEGVFIAGVTEGSGAEDAGILPGHIILNINEIEVMNTSRLQELVARNRPGDIIKVQVRRGGEIFGLDVVLKNKNNTTEIIKTVTLGATDVPELGAEVLALTTRELQELKVDAGVKIVKIRDNKLREARIEEGFVITHIDKKPVGSPQELLAVLAEVQGEFLMEGMYSNGQKVFYGLNF